MLSDHFAIEISIDRSVMSTGPPPDTGESPKASGRPDWISEKSLSYIEKAAGSGHSAAVRLPLITETNRLLPIPDMASLLVYTVLYLQVLFGSWFLFPETVDKHPAMRTLLQILFFGLVDSYDSMFGAMIALPVIAFAALIVITLVSWYFHSRNEIEKWEILTLRWWFGVISPVLVIPTALSCVNSFGRGSIQRNAEAVIILIINLMALAYVVLQLLFLTVPLTKSPFLSKTVVMIWRPEAFYRAFLLMMLPIMVGRVFEDFPRWCHFIPYVATFLCSGAALFYFVEVPMAGYVSNIFWISLPFMISANQFWNIAREVGSYPGDEAYYLGSLGIDLVIIVIVAVLFSLKRKRISRILSYAQIEREPESKLTFEKKFKHLEEHISGKRKFSFFVLQVGLEDRRELLYDWTLLRFYIRRFPGDQDVVLFGAWIVSFFPSESVLFQTLLGGAENLRALSDLNVFMFSQLKRVALFRENTTSMDAIRDLARVRQMSDDCATIMSNFWKSAAKGYAEADLSISRYLGYYITRADSAWMDVLDKYPNSVGAAAEYSLYLLDGKSAFEQAIRWHLKSLDMESGNHLRRDKMFQRFVRVFPAYLKKGIVDPSGRLCHVDEEGHASISRSSSGVSSCSLSTKTSTLSSDNDSGSLRLDSVRTNTFLENAALRIALARYAEQFPMIAVYNARLFMGLKFFFSIFFILLAMLMLTLAEDDRRGLLRSISHMSDVSQYLLLVRQKVDWLVMQTFMTAEHMKQLAAWFPKGESVLNTTAPPVITIANLTELSLYHLDLLMMNVFESSLSREFGSFLATYNVPKNCCISGKVEPSNWSYSIDATLRDYCTGSIILTRTSGEDRVHFAERDDFCNIIVQGSQLEKVLEATTAFVTPEFGEVIGFDQISRPVASRWGFQGQSSLIMAFAPFYLLLFLIPFVIQLVVSVSSWGKTLLECMIRAPSHVCREAAERLDTNIPTKRSTRIPRRHHAPRLSGIAVDFVLTLVIILLIVALGMCRQEIDKDLGTMLGHYSLMSLKRAYTYGISRDLTFLVFLNQIETEGLTGHYTDESGQDQSYRVTSCPYLSIDSFNQSLFRKIEKYRIIEEMQIYGYGDVRSMINYDAELEKSRHTGLCNPYEVILKPNGWAVDVNFYRCVSFDRVESFFIEKALRLGYVAQGITIDDPNFAEMMHIANSRSAIGFTSALEGYIRRAESSENLVTILGITFLVIALALECVALWLDSIDVYRAIQDLDILKGLFLRLNPMAVVQSKDLLSALRIFSNTPKEKVVSACQVVIQNSKEVIIGVSSQFVVDSVNGEIHETFGYLVDQLMGQPLSQFISKEDNDRLYYQMQLMLTGQCPLTYQTDAVGIKDDGSRFSLHVVLIGLSNNGRVADSLVLVCRDIEEEGALKLKIEEAKKQSERIVELILPHPSLRKGCSEANGMLVINDCTVLYADIEGFATFWQQMPPALVLQNLSRIFAKFDKICARESVTKVYQRSDTYMVIGGLFSDPSAGAANVAAVAIEMLASMEELNIELHSNHTVQFGVHNGGTVYAGIIGTDKNFVFHVVGKPVGEAMDLCRNCPPGYVHLSESVAGYLDKGPDKEIVSLDDGTVIARSTQKQGARSGENGMDSAG